MTSSAAPGGGRGPGDRRGGGPATRAPAAAASPDPVRHPVHRRPGPDPARGHLHRRRRRARSAVRARRRPAGSHRRSVPGPVRGDHVPVVRRGDPGPGRRARGPVLRHRVLRHRHPVRRPAVRGRGDRDVAQRRLPLSRPAARRARRIDLLRSLSYTTTFAFENRAGRRVPVRDRDDRHQDRGVPALVLDLSYLLGAILLSP